MPVSSQHPMYAEFLNQWTRCRDVIKGSDAVKLKGKTYLPKLKAQSTDDYNAYKTRALFFSVTDRSLQGLVGSMTRRTPTITPEDDFEEMKDFFDDTSLHNTSFAELFTSGCEEVLSVGRWGMLVDFPKDEGRPYIATYVTESILNWRLDTDGNLEMVMLQEVAYMPSLEDKYELEEVTKYRELEIRNGIYFQTVYDEEGDVLTPSFTPLAKGNTINFIPFISVTPFGISIIPEKPPILDIVDVNLSQYITSADLENGRHFTALPTPVVTGATSDSALHIGGTKAWVIPDAKAKAYFLEFQGSGLGSLETAMKEKTSHMAQFSSKLMDNSTRGSEATDSVKMRHSADSATLSGTALALQGAFNAVYNFIATFENLIAPNIELNKDFIDTKLSATELKELTTSFLEGAIDEEVFFYNLERGELVPHGKTSMDGTKFTPPEGGSTPTE